MISFSQGHKINLDELEVNKKALSVINILVVDYSFRERDYFIKRLLTESILSDSFRIKIDLSTFYKCIKKEFSIKGETIVKIDGENLSRIRPYKSLKKIKTSY
jgi:hypothetical protein|tara:strand:- start:7931 stop:8239 length:309 start_codon:yes stop_codon:yes gene_type:complete